MKDWHLCDCEIRSLINISNSGGGAVGSASDS